MEKIKFGNKTYNLIVNGISSTDEKLMIRVLAENITISSVLEDFSDINDLEKISVVSESDEILQSPYIGYTIMESAKICKNFVIDKININTDEEPIYEDIKADIIEVVLHRPDIRDRVSTLEEQNNILTECIMEMSEAVYG